MWLVLVASLGAMALSAGAKYVVGRERPDVATHVRDVTTPSFPSGHATLATAVYLTLGAVLAQCARSPTSDRWPLTSDVSPVSALRGPLPAVHFGLVVAVLAGEAEALDLHVAQLLLRVRAGLL